MFADYEKSKVLEAKLKNEPAEPTPDGERFVDHPEGEFANPVYCFWIWQPPASV